MAKAWSLILGDKADLKSPKSVFFSESPPGRFRIDASLKV